MSPPDWSDPTHGSLSCYYIIAYIFREANQVANALAKYNLSIDNTRIFDVNMSFISLKVIIDVATTVLFRYRGF